MISLQQIGWTGFGISNAVFIERITRASITTLYWWADNWFDKWFFEYDAVIIKSFLQVKKDNLSQPIIIEMALQAIRMGIMLCSET